MRLPIIKHIVKTKVHQDIFNGIVLLQDIADARGIKEDELDVIGELLSNLEGALAVVEDMKKNNTPEKEALNAFMKRVINATK